ncbi:hypothetical protein Taro_040711 [Colocasia esculenta]|uniref:Uncharacterized protein n=1 Tax=Colocasia esculenta TaxID=4460 RepID=A0A843WJH9_COLES|nr:hypothetical protein [Colocasia esculenta]
MRDLFSSPWALNGRYPPVSITHSTPSPPTRDLFDFNAFRRRRQWRKPSRRGIADQRAPCLFAAKMRPAVWERCEEDTRVAVWVRCEEDTRVAVYSSSFIKPVWTEYVKL